MEIYLNDEHEYLTSDEENAVVELLQFVAKEEDIEIDTEVSITFVDNQEIQHINAEYRDLDEVTDCISFAFEDDSTEDEIIYQDGERPPRVLGDIIISVEKAREQAKDYNHSEMRELGFLAVHGLLHLLGYDHMTEAEEKEMFTKQETLLRNFGLERE